MKIIIAGAGAVGTPWPNFFQEKSKTSYFLMTMKRN